MTTFRFLIALLSVVAVIKIFTFSSCIQFITYYEVEDSYSLENEEKLKNGKYHIIDGAYIKNLFSNLQKDLLVYELGPLCGVSFKHITYVDSVSNIESPNAKILFLTASYDYKTLEKIREVYSLKDTLHIIDRKYGKYAAEKYRRFNLEVFETDSMMYLPNFGILNRDGSVRCIDCSSDYLRSFFTEEY